MFSISILQILTLPSIQLEASPQLSSFVILHQKLKAKTFYMTFDGWTDLISELASGTEYQFLFRKIKI